VKELIRLRLHFDQGTAGDAIALEDYLSNAHIEWHGTLLDKPDWGSDSHAIAVAFHNHALNNMRYIAINSYWKKLKFELPPIPDSSRWIRMIDTSLASPDDIAAVERGSEIVGSNYIVNPHSVVMLHFATPIGNRMAGVT
jgi:glycogen operon protein